MKDHAVHNGSPNSHNAASEKLTWDVGKFEKFGTTLTLVMITTVGAWLTLAEISGAVIAQGELRSSGNRQIVQHREGGTVTQILVKNGDYVQPGQVLLRLDKGQLEAEHAIVTGQINDAVARRGRLIAERDGLERPFFESPLFRLARNQPNVMAIVLGQQRLFFAKRQSNMQQLEQLKERIANLHIEIEGIDGQLKAGANQTRFISQELNDLKGLFKKGFASKTRILALERERSKIEGQRSSLDADRASRMGQINDLEIEIVRLTSTLREKSITELRDLEVQLGEYRERRQALAEKLNATELKAPVAGIVHALAIHTVNGVIKPADPVLAIVPSKTVLVIEAKLDATAVDQVYSGQKVSILFSTFNTGVTPEISGTVSQISADRVDDPDTSENYYTAEITFSAAEKSKLGEKAFKLVAGLPVEVHLQTGERSPFSYLIKPIADQFNRALREG